VVILKNKPCFVNFHCSVDCPNFQIDMLSDKFGREIVEDIGLKEVNCRDCYYNSCKCDDCLFENSKECPEYTNI